MRRYIPISVALLPLLLSFSHAAQTRALDSSEHAFIFSSDDSGTSSYLGVDIADVTAERVSALKLKEEKGVEVTMVDQDAPAGKAGIKEHDVILAMNGTPVESAAQLRRMIHETPPGRVVTLDLSRDGQPVTVKTQLADRHKEFSWPSPGAKDFHVAIPEIHVPEIDIPSITVVMTSSARSGLTVECITPQLGEFFGVKDGNGVLVRSVEKGSRADKAGFRAGDVIVKINDQPIHDTSDFSHAVRSHGASSINVGIIRDKKDLNLNLPVPGHKDSGNLLEEESFDEPLMNAASALELSKLQNELATMKPAVELSAAEARKAAEELRESLCAKQREFGEQTRKQQEQFREEQQRLQRELERMRRGMPWRGLDI